MFRKLLPATLITLCATSAFAEQDSLQPFKYVSDYEAMYDYAEGLALVRNSDEESGITSKIRAALVPVLATEQRAWAQDLDDFDLLGQPEEFFRVDGRLFINVNGASKYSTTLESIETAIVEGVVKVKATVKLDLDAISANVQADQLQEVLKTQTKMVVLNIAANAHGTQTTGYELDVAFIDDQGQSIAVPEFSGPIGEDKIEALERELYLGNLGRTMDVVLDVNFPVFDQQRGGYCPAAGPSSAMVGIGWIAASNGSMMPVLAAAMVDNPSAAGYGKAVTVRDVAYVNINALTSMNVGLTFPDNFDDYTTDPPTYKIVIQSEGAEQSGVTNQMKFLIWTIAMDIRSKEFLLQVTLPSGNTKNITPKMVQGYEQELFHESCLPEGGDKSDGFAINPEDTVTGCNLGAAAPTGGLWILLGLLGLALFVRRG